MGWDPNPCGVLELHVSTSAHPNGHTWVAPGRRVLESAIHGFMCLFLGAAVVSLWLEGSLPCKECQENGVFPQWKLFLVQLLQGEAALGLSSAWHYPDFRIIHIYLLWAPGLTDPRARIAGWSWNSVLPMDPTVPGTSIPCQGRQRQPQVPAVPGGTWLSVSPVPACPTGIIPRAQQLWENLPWKVLTTPGVSGAHRTSPSWAGAAFQPLLGGTRAGMGMGEHPGPHHCLVPGFSWECSLAQAQQGKSPSWKIPEPCRAPCAQISWHRAAQNPKQDISDPKHSRRSLWMLVEVLAEQFR